MDAGKQTRLRHGIFAAILAKPLLECVMGDLFLPAKLKMRCAAQPPGFNMRKHLPLPGIT